jgi:MFS transporter, PPP family, 3-phenylpropionic acid transporter
MPDARIRLSTRTAYFFLFSSFAIISPYLPLYLKGRGFSPSRIGVLLGCLELAGIAGPVFVASVADRHRTYKAFLAAGLLATVVLLVPLHASTAFGVALGCMAAIGFAYRSTIPLLDSLVGRVLPDPSGQYGRVRVAGSVGFILTSLFLQFSGLVSGDAPLSILVSSGAALGLAAGAALLLPAVHPPRAAPGQGVAGAAKGLHGARGSLRGSGFDSTFWAVLTIVFLARFGISAYYSFFSLLLRDRFGLTNVALVWAIGAFAEIATIFWSGPLIRRLGIRRLLLASIAAISVRLSVYALSTSLALVCVTQVLHALTFGVLHTATIAWVNGKIHGPRRGLGMATYAAVGLGIPSFLASSLGGYLLEARGFTVTFLFYAAVPLLAVAALAVFGRRLLPDSSPPLDTRAQGEPPIA